MSVMALERVPADIRRDGGVARMSDPALDRGHQGGRDHPGHGQGPHRPLRRGPGPRVARRRLRRRERGADPRRRGQPHRQVGVHGAVRVRRHQPGRGPAAHLRGRGHDPLQGRGRDRRHQGGGAPPAVHHRRHPPDHPGRSGRALRLGQAAAGPDHAGQEIAETGRLPVPLFCAGGIATPADASLVMQLGAEACFVGSGIFKSSDPPRFARAIVEATTHYRDPADRGQGEPRARRRHARARSPTRVDTRLSERGW